MTSSRKNQKKAKDMNKLIMFMQTDSFRVVHGERDAAMEGK